MANWNTYLAYNTFSPTVSPEIMWGHFLRFNNVRVSNPDNAIKVQAASSQEQYSGWRKENVFGLHQAEDRDILFTYLMSGEKLSDISNVVFVVFNLDMTERFRYTLGNGIQYEDSAFRVSLTDTDTLDMPGKYLYELWLQASAQKESLLFKGALKFKPTSGRIA